MRAIDLAQLRKQYEGTRYAEFVQHHLNRQDNQQRLAGIRGTIGLLPEPLRPSVEGFIDHWNTKAQDESFWQSDTARVLDEVVTDGRRLADSVGVQADDEAMFNLFNIVTMNYAVSAENQPKMREFMGIQSARGTPIWSALALIIPAASFLQTRSNTASFSLALGSAISNLGYVLLAAGIVAGTFHVLALRTRAQVFVAAAAAWLLGVLLSNAA